MSNKPLIYALALALLAPSMLLAQSRVAGPRTTARPAVAARPTPARTAPARSVAHRAVEPEPEIIEEEPIDDGGDCGGGACGCNQCCQPSLWFARGEYLGWWTNGATTPALVTTSPVGTAQASAGVLGTGSTAVLFTNESLNSDIQSGGRITLGSYFDPNRCFGWEANYLRLGQGTDSFFASSATNAILARPFFNTQTNAPDARLISFPGVVSGNVAVDATTDFQSFEVLFRGPLWECPNSRTSYLLGYRYGDLGDKIRISENTLALSGPAAGTQISLFDEFQTTNIFNGVEFGISSQWETCSCWSIEVLAKLAVGNNSSRARISGQRTTINTQGAAIVNSGLLAQSTNIGDYGQSQFSLMPELGVKLNYDISPRWRASVGYSVVAWTNVLRASEQIDATINPTQIPPGVLSGVGRPAFPFDTTDFCAQGVTAGLECRF